MVEPELVFYCQDPDTGEFRRLDSFPVEDLGGGWHRQGCWIYADFGQIDLGIVAEPGQNGHAPRAGDHG